MGFCHCIIQWILFIATFVLAITAICTFGNEREDYSNVNIKKKWIVIPGIIILCWFISPIGAIIKLYNKNIEYTNQLDKQQYARKMFFDKL